MIGETRRMGAWLDVETMSCSAGTNSAPRARMSVCRESRVRRSLSRC